MTDLTALAGRERLSEACSNVPSRRLNAAVLDPAHGCVDWYCYDLRGAGTAGSGAADKEEAGEGTQPDTAPHCARRRRAS
jgi:hypothetical protein